MKTKRINLNKVQEILASYENKKLTQKLLNEIMEQLTTTETRPKVIEKDGRKYVWCNFHQDYEPAENFATKTNKKGEVVFKSNCKEGDRILRKFRSLRRKLEEVNLALYRQGLMNKDLENDIMNKFTLDLAQEYSFDIVTIIDVIYPKELAKKAIEILGSKI